MTEIDDVRKKADRQDRFPDPSHEGKRFAYRRDHPGQHLLFPLDIDAGAEVARFTLWMLLHFLCPFTSESLTASPRANQPRVNSKRFAEARQAVSWVVRVKTTAAIRGWADL